MAVVIAYAGCDALLENERDVVARWKNGDKAAFEVLVREHMSEAYLTALGLTGNPDDARDLSQDAFIKAFEARKSFDDSRRFAPWFYRILKNHCLNFLQRVRKRTESLHHDEAQSEERFAAAQKTALEQLESNERKTLVRAAIAHLSFEHREVIVLKSYRGLSYREMSDLLDTPIGTVMSRLYYARQSLKSIIEEWEAKGAPTEARYQFGEHPAPGEVA